jgi:NAD(P)-dependent dehydrogenase (short-subunit alcohol dehydrogenase family)
MDDLFGLAGKKAVVIGGGLGMGRATARLLSQVGALVAVVDLERERADEVASEIKAVPIAADVTKRAEAERAVQEAAKALGGLDLMMNMVGRNTYVSLMEMSEEQLERVLSVNLRHHLYCETEFARALQAAGHGGAIVNVSSVSGVRASTNHAAYGFAKAALISLTKTAAIEWAPLGIRVNSIAPGSIRTDRNNHSAEMEAAAGKIIPMGRYGDQTEIAKVALFLLSDLSSYITGQTIVVDGGITISSEPVPRG